MKHFSFSTQDLLKALAIVNVFETGKPFGEFTAVAVLNDGAGISYGISQFTHRSGSLAAVIERYLKQGGKVGRNLLENALPNLKRTDPVVMRAYAGDERFKKALRSAAVTREMREAQLQIMFEKYLRRAIDECDRLTRLINQLRMLARAEAGEIAIASDLVDVAALAASVVEQIEPVAGARGIAISCADGQRIVARGDAGWLQRLLLILLDNAIKFTGEGGRIGVTFARANGLVRVAVTDTGTGIRPDALPHVFERFYRADRARSRKTSGAGLGLALAKWIVDRHHGTIAVESRPGEGSTFTVSLPAFAERRDQSGTARPIDASPAGLSMSAS